MVRLTSQTAEVSLDVEARGQEIVVRDEFRPRTPRTTGKTPGGRHDSSIDGLPWFARFGVEKGARQHVGGAELRWEEIQQRRRHKTVDDQVDAYGVPRVSYPVFL